MKKALFTKGVLLLILGCLVVISSLTWAETYRKRSDDVHIENYYRKNGTYVAPHYRRPPNAYRDDNYSWKPNQPRYNPSYYQPTKKYKSEWYQKDWDVYYDNLNKSYRSEIPPKKKSSTDLPLFQEKIKQPDIYYDKPQQQTPPYQKPIYQKNQITNINQPTKIITSHNKNQFTNNLIIINSNIKNQLIKTHF